MIRLGSGVVDVTIAVLFIHPVADGFTVPLIKTVLEVSSGNVPKLRDPVYGLNVIPPFIENSTPIILGGILSVKTTF